MPSLAWATDLHLDHCTPARRTAFLDAVRRSAGSPFVLTGDLSVARRLETELRALADAARRPLYFVLGNHDHFGASVADVRDLAAGLAQADPPRYWLPPAGVVDVGPGIALIGVDGWADGRHGDPLGTPLHLNDDRLIAELAAQTSRRGKLAVKRALADADAARLEVLLRRAGERAAQIVVATHVPPFVEALPAAGHLAGAEWLPLLVCGATGTVLREYAASHPSQQLLVLAGHTHAAADVRIAPNLRCLVGGARYGEPAVTTLAIG